MLICTLYRVTVQKSLCIAGNNKYAILQTNYIKDTISEINHVTKPWNAASFSFGKPVWIIDNFLILI